MIPSKAKDFTGSHGGFEGEEEGGGNFFPRVIRPESLYDGGGFTLGDPPTPCSRRGGLLYILKRVFPSQPPTDGL